MIEWYIQYFNSLTNRVKFLKYFFEVKIKCSKIENPLWYLPHKLKNTFKFEKIRTRIYH